MKPVQAIRVRRRWFAAAVLFATLVAQGGKLRRGWGAAQAAQTQALILDAPFDEHGVVRGSAPPRPGDFDFDDDLDLIDFAAWLDCWTLGGDPAQPPCATGDFDLDQDFDLDDFAGLQRHFLRPISDTDGDRIPDLYESNDGVFAHAYATGTDPFDPDTDGDALADGDEAYGTASGLDLRALGASPLMQDVFVEIDWTDDEFDVGPHTHRPSPAAVLEIVAAFAQSPRPNPYSAPPGVRLHVDFGQGGVFTGGNLVPGSPEFVVFGAEFDGLRDANLAPERLGYFHYALFTHRHNSKTNIGSGIADLRGDRMMVTLPFFPEDDNRVSKTFMHELGHNLNLQHGGDEGLNQKPNYNSIMNYRYQFPGVDTDCDALGDGVPNYSSGSLAMIDESHLDECLGICGAGLAIDWNGSGGECETDIAFNVTEGPGGDPALDALHDHDDWGALAFDGIAEPNRSAAEVIACEAPPD